MIEDILKDIFFERQRQIDLWGETQQHPDGSSDYFSYQSFPCTARGMRHVNDIRVDQGRISWDGILYEELMEAFEEINISPENLRKELIQCAAVIIAWIGDIDSRV